MCLRYPSKSSADTPDGRISHLAPSPDMSFQEKNDCRMYNLPACCSRRFSSDLFSVVPYSRTLPATQGEGPRASQQCCSFARMPCFHGTPSWSIQSQIPPDQCLSTTLHISETTQPLRASPMVFSTRRRPLARFAVCLYPVSMVTRHLHDPASRHD